MPEMEVRTEECRHGSKPREGFGEPGLATRASLTVGQGFLLLKPESQRGPLPVLLGEEASEAASKRCGQVLEESCAARRIIPSASSSTMSGVISSTFQVPAEPLWPPPPPCHMSPSLRRTV